MLFTSPNLACGKFNFIYYMRKCKAVTFPVRLGSVFSCTSSCQSAFSCLTTTQKSPSSRSMILYRFTTIRLPWDRVAFRLIIYITTTTFLTAYILWIILTIIINSQQILIKLLKSYITKFLHVSQPRYYFHRIWNTKTNKRQYHNPSITTIKC